VSREIRLSVVLAEATEVTLKLFTGRVPGGAPGHAEALVEQRAIHAFDEAVGSRRPGLRGAMGDVLQGEGQLLGILLHEDQYVWTSDR